MPSEVRDAIAELVQSATSGAVLAPARPLRIQSDPGAELEIRRRQKGAERAARLAALEGSGAIYSLTDADVDAIASGQIQADVPCLAVALTWLEQDIKPVLLLAGSVGRGKTFAAAHCIAVTGRGLMVTAHHVLRLFAGRYGDVLDEQRAVLRSPFLVVDDVGREPPAERAAMAAALNEIIDQRRSIRRRTVITTNFGMSDRAAVPNFLREYDDERLRSRLHQSAERLVDRGADLRRYTDA